MDKEKLKSIRKTYKEELKELKEGKLNLFEDHTSSLLEEDGRAHIKVDLRNEEIYEPYSGKEKLNTSLFEHIQNEVRYIKPVCPICLDFYIDKKDEMDIEKITSLYEKTARFAFASASNELRKNRIVIVVSLVLGILFLIAYELFMFLFNGNFFGEIISIASWVFIWEAVDRYFFTRLGIQKDGLLLARLASAKLVFHVKD
ncbi:MAG TPA: hypothetical protein DCR94_03535 [Firmicutes bacterium]|nr:hypothetical protein [Bacillota bacterium]